MNSSLNHFLSGFHQIKPKPRQDEPARAYSDNERREPRGELCGATKAPAPRANKRELSGNKSDEMKRCPVKTLLIKGKIPAFVCLDKILYAVSPFPLNMSRHVEKYDLLLVNTDTKLIYSAEVTAFSNLSCLYFETDLAQ